MSFSNVMGDILYQGDMPPNLPIVVVRFDPSYTGPSIHVNELFCVSI